MKFVLECNGHLEIFSRPQVMENSRQYLLLRTDILQKTVVGCPCSLARLNQFIGDNNIFATFKIDKCLKRSVPTESLLFLVQGAHLRTYNELLHGLCSKTVQIIISVQKDAEGCLIFGLLFSCTVHWQGSAISYFAKFLNIILICQDPYLYQALLKGQILSK